MTAICGIEHKGRVYMGADSAVTDGSGRMCVIRTSKIVQRDGWVFGVAGDGGACSAIVHRVKPPKLMPGSSIERLVCVDLIDEIRTVLNGVGLVDPDWAALFAVRGELYYVDNCLDAARSTRRHNAVGSGSMAALGALDALEESELTPRQKLEIALEISERRYDSVRRPFRYLTTEPL